MAEGEKKVSKLYYKNKAVLFECDRKLCGDRCFEDCHLTTEVEHAKKLDEEQAQEYDVAPAPEEQSEMYYIAVPVKRENRKK